VEEGGKGKDVFPVAPALETPQGFSQGKRGRGGRGRESPPANLLPALFLLLGATPGGKKKKDGKTVALCPRLSPSFLKEKKKKRKKQKPVHPDPGQGLISSQKKKEGEGKKCKRSNNCPETPVFRAQEKEERKEGEGEIPPSNRSTNANPPN